MSVFFFWVSSLEIIPCKLSVWTKCMKMARGPQALAMLIHSIQSCWQAQSRKAQRLGVGFDKHRSLWICQFSSETMRHGPEVDWHHQRGNIASRGVTTRYIGKFISHGTVLSGNTKDLEAFHYFSVRHVFRLHPLYDQTQKQQTGPGLIHNHTMTDCSFI